MNPKEKIEYIKSIAFINGYEYEKCENELYYFRNKFAPKLFQFIVCKEKQIEFCLKYGISITKKTNRIKY